MICPGCSYENKADALVCNLCQRVLRREGARSQPAARGAYREPVAPPPVEAAAPQPSPAPSPPRPAWGVIALGLVLLLWGISALTKQWKLVSFPPYPKDATPEQILAWDGYGYVRWDRGLVRKDDLVYRVGSPPVFRATDPRVQFEAQNASEVFAKRKTLVGNYVRLTNQLPVLQHFVLTEKRVTYRVRNGVQEGVVDERTICRRIYAPMLGTGGRMWVLSKCFPDSADLAADPWLIQGGYAGILVPLGQDREFSKLDAEWTRSNHAHIPPDALMIVDQPPTVEDDVARWYPLGTSNALWIEVPPEADIDLAYPEGVVDLHEDKHAAMPDSLRKVLVDRGAKEASLPKDVRLVVLTTPPQFIEQKKLGSKVSKFGLGLLIAGVAIVVSSIMPWLRALTGSRTAA